MLVTLAWVLGQKVNTFIHVKQSSSIFITQVLYFSAMLSTFIPHEAPKKKIIIIRSREFKIQTVNHKDNASELNAIVF